MATLVFDIETAAQPVENFDEVQQEYLFRETEKIGDAVEKQAKREEIARFMSLWPFTSQVVCIAMLNAETLRGQTIYLAEDFEDDAADAGPVEFVPCADESELLTAFWDVAKHYDNVVTFNGRGFDVPFVYLRSAQLNVPITKKNWLGYRYATEPHCDLAEQRERTRRRGAEVQPGFLLQSVRHRIAQEPRGDGYGCERYDDGGPLPGDRGVLPAGRTRHGGAVQDLEGTAGGDQIIS
jgi:DNA polymerase elongation subunit (family B)